MISLLLPTRRRPNSLIRLYASAMMTADNPEDIEIIAYVDYDDNSYMGIQLPRLDIIHGERLRIAEAWNKCWEGCNGEYLGLVGDDVIFKTKGWDTKVLEAFEQVEDKIAFVYGDDGSLQGKTFGTHGFIHQRWAVTVGYFVPPQFSANMVDRWLNEVAEALGRLRYIDISMEHLHHAFNKATFDQTYEDAQIKFPENERLWEETKDKRLQDILKLKERLHD